METTPTTCSIKLELWICLTPQIEKQTRKISQDDYFVESKSEIEQSKRDGNWVNKSEWGWENYSEIHNQNPEQHKPNWSW